MSGATARDLAAEFKAGRAQRPDIKKPVWHQSLRLPHGETISDHKWVEVADDYMRSMGFTEQHQYTIIKHSAAEGEHVHIIANRVSLSGSVYLGQNENLKSTKLISALERAHKLAITPGAPDDIRPKKKKLKKNEIEASARTGIVPPRAAIQAAIDLAVAQRIPNLQAFRQFLDARGITVHVHTHPETGKPRGLSFEKSSVRFSGSQLGEDYKFSRLSARLSSAAKPAATRTVANNQGAGTMMNTNIFKKKIEPAPVAGRDFQEIVPRGAFGSLASGIPSIPGLPASDRTTPPTLSGRLMPVRLSSGRGMDYDLFWKDRQDGKASFRWQGEQQRLLILAQPSEKNVSALFDAAHEKGIGMPLIEITGSPEFQRLAAVEAARRGLPVDTSKLADDAARELYRQTWDRAHGEAANSIAAAAYESDDREDARRAAEKQRQQQEREKNVTRDGDDDRRRLGTGTHTPRG